MDNIGNGVLRDESSRNTRFDLIPPEAMQALAETLHEGATKYGERNWEQGIPIGNCLDHALGHITAYMGGTGNEDHLAHALCNLAFAITMERRMEAKAGDMYCGVTTNPKPGALVYLACPIDYYDMMEEELLPIMEVLVKLGMSVYAPAAAFHNGITSPDAINKINAQALSVADVLVAVLPKGATSIGVPREIERAINTHGLPVFVVTNMKPGVALQDTTVVTGPEELRGALDGWRNMQW